MLGGLPDVFHIPSCKVTAHMFWAELRYCVLSRPCRSPLEDMMSGTRFQRLIQVGKPGVLQSIPELSRWKVLNLIKSLQASEHSTILFLMVMFVQLVPRGYTPWFLLPPHSSYGQGMSKGSPQQMVSSVIFVG